MLGLSTAGSKASKHKANQHRQRRRFSKDTHCYEQPNSAFREYGAVANAALG